MNKSIALIATLDTKGEEIGYIKELIEGRGHQTITIDIGILGEPSFEPTISHHQVLAAAGSSREQVIALNQLSLVGIPVSPRPLKVPATEGRREGRR